MDFGVSCDFMRFWLVYCRDLVAISWDFVVFFVGYHSLLSAFVWISCDLRVSYVCYMQQQMMCSNLCLIDGATYVHQQLCNSRSNQQKAFRLFVTIVAPSPG